MRSTGYVVWSWKTGSIVWKKANRKIWSCILCKPSGLESMYTKKPQQIESSLLYIKDLLRRSESKFCPANAPIKKYEYHHELRNNANFVSIDKFYFQLWNLTQLHLRQLLTEINDFLFYMFYLLFCLSPRSLRNDNKSAAYLIRIKNEWLLHVTRTAHVFFILSSRQRR